MPSQGRRDSPWRKMLTLFRPLLLLISILPAIAISPAPQDAKLGPAKELPYIRDYFYAGGKYVDDGTGKGEHIFVEQLYVERLTPVRQRGNKPPIVFIHGQAQTGTNWLNKPDGGRGWASFFTSKGYTIYIIDQTSRGRSPRKPANGTLTTYSAETIQQRFTAGQDYNLWPQARLHTQWPGTGKMGDPIFDAYYASNVDFLSSATTQQSTVQSAGAALLDRIGCPVILLAHSQGGVMPWLIADVRPQLVHAIVSIEPTGPPFQEGVFATTSARPYGLTDVPLTYDPPVADPTKDLVRSEPIAPEAPVDGAVKCILQADAQPRQLVNLKDIPVVVITAEASYHVPYDWCTVKYLKQAGVQTEHLYLADKRVKGNGHLVFLEKNSDRVGQVVVDWIEKHK